MIGGSFVEAKEVPIADKFHVLLEALVIRQLSHLNITTSAFGRGGTDQIEQLDVLSTLAEAGGIPVIDQYDYILRQGGKIEEAHWVHDWHWNPPATGGPQKHCSNI